MNDGQRQEEADVSVNVRRCGGHWGGEVGERRKRNPS